MSDHQEPRDPFKFPTWVDKALEKKVQGSTVELVNPELVALRDFYRAWTALHAIQGDKRNRDVREKHEAAADQLVKAAEVVRSTQHA